ncbi:O-methyltransferase COMT-type [Parasponia andersonii]|uniref:O-methyltransferase COMT-type n=1 Tax=Parasponia andersonii TaxID=3476 RepID=A0A2P5DXD0_PARAD|nr:O-methyltransferase COMT-type [Parasponia andersonii]
MVQDQDSSELFQAQAHLYKHVLSYMSSMSLKCAVQLGVPDAINNHGQPITLPELVSALQIHPKKTDFVRRIMRLLAHSGFFKTTKLGQNNEGEEEDEVEAYDLTPTSRLLLKNRVPNLSAFVVGLSDPAFVTPAHFLADWLRADDDQVLTAPFDSTFGLNLWDYANKNPEFNDDFNEAMASDSEMMNLVVKHCKPVFEGLCSVVDVGGGTGKIARIITEEFPHLKFTVLDLPHVIANLPETENLKFIEGDMFKHIPPTDAVFLKLILHDWSDEQCLKVLKNCREAIPNNAKGKVIIIDIVLNDINNENDEDDPGLGLTADAKLHYDLMMMACLAGKERSEKEWKKLFLGAGFSHYKIKPIFGLRSLIEVFP